MSSTTELVNEHLVILGVLEGLEREMAAMRRTGAVPKAFLRDLLTFCRVYIDRGHHGKEEGCLFPCLERRGMGREDGPIGVMLQEHEWGRALVRAIEAALDRHAQGKASVADVLTPCESYLALLRQHIDKENGVLYPMGDLRMVPADHEGNRRCYATREEELGRLEHERMEKLAKELSGGKAAHDH
jgi:hemerythrin-like domain-containing protein